MHTKQVTTPSAKLANYATAAVLVLAPFHAFLTVWASTLVGHYTLLRLWDDVLGLLVFGVACAWLARDAPLRAQFASSLLVRLIAAYAGLTLLLGAVSLSKGDVAAKALAYGVLVNLRYLGWFLAVLLAAQRSPWLRRNWPRLLVVPAAVVVVFAVLQFTVLPHNFLSHFGYNAATTIAPTETINHNSHYIRVESTLRGANPLGAYLVIILAGLSVLAVRAKRRLLCVGLGVAGLFALFATGSRSAWIGTVLSAVVLAWFQFSSRRARQILVGSAVAVVIVAAGLFVLLRSNPTVQNSLLHTQDNSTAAVSSNAAHASATKQGISDVLHQPLGDGPGTAGPASVYNSGHAGRIAENNYVQTAQETGWLGLALFLCIMMLVAVELYARIGYSRLALVLLASLVGLSFVNLLSHAWTDDTLAYIWWGLAGVALAVPQRDEHEI